MSNLGTARWIGHRLAEKALLGLWMAEVYYLLTSTLVGVPSGHPAIFAAGAVGLPALAVTSYSWRINRFGKTFPLSLPVAIRYWMAAESCGLITAGGCLLATLAASPACDDGPIAVAGCGFLLTVMAMVTVPVLARKRGLYLVPPRLAACGAVLAALAMLHQHGTSLGYTTIGLIMGVAAVGMQSLGRVGSAVFRNGFGRQPSTGPAPAAQ